MSEQAAETNPAPEAVAVAPPQEPAATTPAPESAEPTAAEGTPEEPDQPWDAERAMARIRKVSSENKALRERATQAEAQAASVPDLQAQTQTLGTENLRLRVGYELGLPISLAERLQGSTRDELIADAETLVQLVAPAVRAAAPPAARPVEQLRPGATPTDVPSVTETEYPSHWFPKVQRGS